MATIFFSGFEAGNSEEVDLVSGTASIQTSNVRTGVYSLKCNPTTTGTGFCTLASTTGAGASSAANVVTAFCRFYFYYVTKPASSSEEIFRARNVASLKGSVRIDSTGVLSFYDSTNTIVTTGSTVLSANTWYLIEVKVGTGASAAWEVKINGTSEISGTSNLLASNNTRWNFGKSVNSNGQSVEFYYDDLLVSDSAYPGAGECRIAVPNAIGTYQTATVGAGAGHYQAVSEVPEDGDTSYLVSDGVATDAETETIQNHTASGANGTVNCVRSYIITKRDGGTNGSIKIRFRSNTTNSDGTAFATGASYSQNSLFYDTDPATSIAWTLSGLDTLQVGIVENSANKSRITAAYAFMDTTPSAGTVYPRNMMMMGVG